MPAEPITPKGRRTMQRILAAARQVMARTGYVTMRVSDVAEEAGLSLGALYRYFDNKEDLFDSLIGSTHEDLYQASAGGGFDFAVAPYDALFASNRGYLEHYFENRDVLRVLMEVMTVDTRFRDFWWEMRQRHIRRFLAALGRHHGLCGMTQKEATLRCEAVCSMVEMSAYAWFAQDELNKATPSLDEATKTLTDIWYSAFFGNSAEVTDDSPIQLQETN
jgi:AcrR family transcriptional regulator